MAEKQNIKNEQNARIKIKQIKNEIHVKEAEEEKEKYIREAFLHFYRM